MSYRCLPFERLSPDELYRILQLRAEVFVVEQLCPYLDPDDRDQGSHHLMYFDAAGRMQAYLRILPPGLSYEAYASIGRVVTSGAVRRTGVGRSLMEEGIRLARQLYPGVPLKISAQHYLLGFYQSFGFEERGAIYLEDDIPHIAMVLEAP